MTFFGHLIHWRVILFDGRDRVAYCVDPYGDKGPVCFNSSRPQQVLRALQAIMRVRLGWRLEVCANQWQLGNDGHSCGIWVIWLCKKLEKFTHFVTTCDIGSDFESWATLEAP